MLELELKNVLEQLNNGVGIFEIPFSSEFILSVNHAELTTLKLKCYNDDFIPSADIYDSANLVKQSQSLVQTLDFCIHRNPEIRKQVYNVFPDMKQSCIKGG